jgi:hypothetical protein
VAVGEAVALAAAYDNTPAGPGALVAALRPSKRPVLAPSSTLGQALRAFLSMKYLVDRIKYYYSS